MKKYSLKSINLDCYMQQDNEFETRECYRGVISKSKNGNIRFEENANAVRAWERNPKIFDGKFINLTRQKNGALKVNMKTIKTESNNFNINDFAFGVYNELTNALNSLQ